MVVKKLKFGLELFGGVYDDEYFEKLRKISQTRTYRASKSLCQYRFAHSQQLLVLS